MKSKYKWQEAKRLANLEKHRLDFIDAYLVIESPYRFDIETVRRFVPGHIPRIISFRTANSSEREVYYDWLENDYNDA